MPLLQRFVQMGNMLIVARVSFAQMGLTLVEEVDAN